MTLETAKKRLELAKEGKDPMGVEFWEAKIAHKLTLPKYSQLVKEEVKPSSKTKGSK